MKNLSLHGGQLGCLGVAWFGFVSDDDIEREQHNRHCHCRVQRSSVHTPTEVGACAPPQHSRQCAFFELFSCLVVSAVFQPASRWAPLPLCLAIHPCSAADGGCWFSFPTSLPVRRCMLLSSQLPPDCAPPPQPQQYPACPPQQWCRQSLLIQLSRIFACLSLSAFNSQLPPDYAPPTPHPHTPRVPLAVLQTLSVDLAFPCLSLPLCHCLLPSCSAPDNICWFGFPLFFFAHLPFSAFL